MLNNDLLPVTNIPNQVAKSSDIEAKQNDEGCCNKEKFEESHEKAFKDFSTNNDE